LTKKLDNTHTTGAEQQKTRLTPIAIRKIGDLSATFNICIMRFFLQCIGRVHRMCCAAFVAAIMGKVRPASDVLGDWPMLRLL
jgi:hypothetical protein